MLEYVLCAQGSPNQGRQHPSRRAAGPHRVMREQPHQVAVYEGLLAQAPGDAHNDRLKEGLDQRRAAPGTQERSIPSGICPGRQPAGLGVLPLCQGFPGAWIEYAAHQVLQAAANSASSYRAESFNHVTSVLNAERLAYIVR